LVFLNATYEVDMKDCTQCSGTGIVRVNEICGHCYGRGKVCSGCGWPSSDCTCDNYEEEDERDLSRRQR